VNDYVKTIFLPHKLQGKENYNIDDELKAYREEAIIKFFKDVPIGAICRLSDRWHEPGRMAQLNKAKTFDGSWEPLFSGDLPSYEAVEYEAVESRFSDNLQTHGKKGSKIIVTPLTNSAELTKEGDDLGHCVGGYTRKCLREFSHILSLRDETPPHLSNL
jgi:hypothetical protein